MINTGNSYRQGVEYILACGSITAWCVHNGHSRRIRIISRISSCGNVQSRPARLLQSLDAPRADLFSEVDSTDAAIVSLTLKVICVRLSNVMNFNVTRI